MVLALQMLLKIFLGTRLDVSSCVDVNILCRTENWDVVNSQTSFIPMSARLVNIISMCNSTDRDTSHSNISYKVEGFSPMLHSSA